MHGWSKWAADGWTSLLFGVVIPTLAVLMPVLWWVRTDSARSLSSNGWTVLGWIPGARRLHRLNTAATFADVLHMTVKAGVPWGRAMRDAGAACGNRRYRRAAFAIAKSLDAGESLAGSSSDAIEKQLKKLPSLVRVALKSSDQRVFMESSLLRAAKAYERRSSELHSALISWVPAMLTFGLAGGITAAYAVALMWPYAVMLKTMASGLWR
ncbi:type II secretion system F family protein [Aeoliella mucimassa]|uniref:Bacterial type II secretion system protein F domain protein n=1 Tax=Aeoliella mucimassa TaxID=2527972 RepID=A0A518AH78_9BACT|nr:type II secretion system F family protein [Aeoliella mucimassa]QDU54059.1 Bacterial type II secretion system protein F domain protein [Aeoliella mucimassa]